MQIAQGTHRDRGRANEEQLIELRFKESNKHLLGNRLKYSLF